MGRTGLEDRFGKGTVLELALLSELPDVDALLKLTGDPFYILSRRTFTHSLLGFPLLCLAAGAVFYAWRRDVPYRTHVGLGLLACTVHVDEADAAVARVRQEPLARRLLWFFKMPVWSVERRDGRTMVTVWDLRFKALLLPWRVPFAACFVLDGRGKVIDKSFDW